MTYPNDIFKDLVVIELATVLAGPAVGMFFAELGARVIKIESPNGGDVTRSWKLAIEEEASNASAYFHSINYKKEHLFLDLEEKEALEQVYALVQTADIVVSNFKSSSAQRLKVDYKHLKKFNSSIIYAELIAFDHTSKKVGYDAVMQAEAGFLSISGTKDGELVKMPVALIDLMAAHQLKEAILIALLRKFKEGVGAHIEVSLLDAGIASLANQASNFLNAGYVAQPMGMLHPNIAPYGELFLLSDGNKIVLAIGDDKQFGRLVKAMGLEQRSEFETNPLRLKNRAALYPYLADSISEKNLEEIEPLLESYAVPYGHVKSIKQVMDYARNNNLVLSDNDSSQRIRTAVFKFKT